MLDVTATLDDRRALAATIRRVAAELFIPLTVGGGIRSVDDGKAMFAAGADKVSLNSAALSRPGLITELAALYGNQAVVVAIDAKRSGDGYAVFGRSGSSDAGRDAVHGARGCGQGRGRNPLTSIDRDGTRAGFDCAPAAAQHRRGHSGHRIGRSGHAGSLSRGLHRRTRGCGAGGIHFHFAEPP